MRSLITSTIAAVIGLALAYWFHAPAPIAATSTPPGNATAVSPRNQHSPTPETTPTFNGNLKAALAGNDPFAAAGRAMAWLNSATAADFDALRKDPKSFPVPNFAGFSDEFRAAFFQALAERWFTVDPDAFGAMRSFQNALSKHHKNEAEDLSLLIGAARARPVAVLNTLGLEDNKALSREQIEAFRILGQRDPAKARSFLERLPEKDRKRAEAAIIAGIATTDPLSALALSRNLQASLQGFPNRAILAAAERIGLGMLRQVFAAAEGRFDNETDLPRLLLAFPDLAQELKATKPAPGAPNPYFDASLIDQADRMTPEQRAALLAMHDQLPARAGDVAVRDAVSAALASAWARTEPEAAAAWALARAKPFEPADTANRAAHLAFLRWIHTDRSAALEWFNTFPESPLRDAIAANASTYLAEDGDLEAALALYRPTTTDFNHGATEHLAQLYAKRDPAGAAKWLAGLPAEVIDGDAVTSVMNRWYSQDRTAVAQWLESLPAGLGRDEGVKEFAERALQESATAAAAWVSTIKDPKLRQQAAAFVYPEFSREDSARALAWINELPSVDESWRAKFLRRQK